VGEEWGFLGTAMVLGLFMMLMMQIVKTTNSYISYIKKAPK